MIPITPPTPDNPPRETVNDMIRASARRNPARLAVVCGDTTRTWAQFDARANQVANALIALGVGKGDRVAMLAPNSVEYAEVFVGTLRAGAVITPLSTLAAGEALEKMLLDCGAKVFFLAYQYRDLAWPFLGNLPAQTVAMDFNASLPGFESLLADAPATDPGVVVSLDDPCNLIYSSGTTGTPKGILHNHWMRAAQMSRVGPNGYTDDDARTLISTPLYSNTTIVCFLPALVGGGTVYLMPKFDARRYLEMAQSERITHTMLVPVQYKRIMDVPGFDDFDLSSMRRKFSTSAPLRADVKRDVLARFPGKLMEYYGLTEGGGVTVLIADEHPDKLHTVGRPAEFSEIRIIDPEGHPLPPGEVGEIVGRSPTMMSGYFGRDDLTADYIWTDENGTQFFRSGDMGSFDADGFLTLSDRKKDMIISGGLNIFANDLELVLLDDPDVTDAAVVGVPSDAWGETPLGLVVLRQGAERGEDDIRDAANARLGKSHRLSAVEIRDSLPRSSIGKILKRELRQPYWQVAGHDI
ncbi:acyl--CoA ligase [Lutimaribacter sp. EGI FJ00015]|uniref:Acyl--CoA ligase n=1 Tax=Lutimaribacter degradans TaxID=2945989 RepID=A0ACC5ZWW6_9RHOB|nr:class I adenylate-forming enzyme family protein [Lutimaribacter sp. EGI FJ00013]MCM2562811.1 acyl--CoA ligase [Lutimaribacter sp. EGI FJ00013]MCO0613968.1 acyl--CoA ligase [Lutimaribacter sp. EGI FJ00015]MCO0636940.1 acyl--CoA ligase [Lutimaribacter sp. EGI FJ00014]